MAKAAAATERSRRERVLGEDKITRAAVRAAKTDVSRTSIAMLKENPASAGHQSFGLSRHSTTAQKPANTNPSSNASTLGMSILLVNAETVSNRSAAIH